MAAFVNFFSLSPRVLQPLYSVLSKALKLREAGKVLTAAIARTLAQTTDPVAAIERLRDMADLMEAQILQENSVTH